MSRAAAQPALLGMQIATTQIVASSRKALFGALAANLGIAVTKFIVGAVTNSSVMIAEGIHSLVDSGNSGLMLYGGRRSRRGPDDHHPFGHGMEMYFWSLVVAMVVFGGGGGFSIYEGIHALQHPRTITHLWPTYVVIGIAAVFEGASLYVGVREFNAYRRERKFTESTIGVLRESKDPAIFVTVLEDTAALIGLAIAAIGVTLSYVFAMPVFDGVASMLIGVVLMIEALFLGIECRGLIIGESARAVISDRIRRAIADDAGGNAIEMLRTLQLGPESVLVFVRLSPHEADGEDLPALLRRLTDAVRRVAPRVCDVFFELAPR